MQIVAINGGPRRGRISKTTMLLEAFLSGCRQGGAEVETINLRE
ncbi:MAG TPA: flavodoxin family protein, partial [Syntrophomonas sp.]|nr:flavodoxin family protein [Syntrophomonas sp.]